MPPKTPFSSPAIVRPGGVVPELGPMPTPAEMSALSNADLIALLQRHGVREDWNSLIAQKQRFTESFHRIAPVDEATLMARTEALYQPAVHDVRKIARRTQERYTTIEAMDGDINAVFVRVAELDDVTCDGCSSLAGFEGTLADQEAAGLPGNQECGGNCRCQLVRVEGGRAAGPLLAVAAAVAAVAAFSEDEDETEAPD